MLNYSYHTEVRYIYEIDISNLDYETTEKLYSKLQDIPHVIEVIYHNPIIVISNEMIVNYLKEIEEELGI